MKRPLVVEIIGPAGSGKSSVTAAILSLGVEVVKVVPPHPRSWRNLAFYVRGCLVALPVLLPIALARNPAERLSRGNVASVVVLSSWWTRLRASGPDSPAIFIIDQGPVYYLAELYKRGPARLVRQAAWWDRMFRRWSEVLDCVVSLDADDTVLIPRIVGRHSDHAVKHMTEAEGRAFLSSWRSSLRHVLGELAGRDSELRVEHYDSSRLSPEDLASSLLVELTRMKP